MRIQKKSVCLQFFTAILLLIFLCTFLPYASAADYKTFSCDVGSYFSYRFANNPDNYAIYYSVDGTLPPGLRILSSIDSDGANLTLCGTCTAAGQYHFELSISDYGNFSIDFTVSEPVSEPSFLTTSLPCGVVGEAYSASVTATGGGALVLGQYYYGECQELPAGLTFRDQGNGKGTISGTPTKAGTYQVAFCASNKAGEGYATYTIDISEPSKAYIKFDTKKSLPNATVGESYSVKVKASSSEGDPKVELLSGESLPSGLSCKQNYGYALLSGIPAKAGSYQFTMIAYYSEYTAKQTFTIVVNPSVETVSSSASAATSSQLISPPLSSGISETASGSIPEISASSIGSPMVIAPAPPVQNPGLSPAAIVWISVGGGLLLAGGAVIIYLLIKRKHASPNLPDRNQLD